MAVTFMTQASTMADLSRKGGAWWDKVEEVEPR